MYAVIIVCCRVEHDAQSLLVSGHFVPQPVLAPSEASGVMCSERPMAIPARNVFSLLFFLLLRK
jgi:hypothetical protein